MKKLNLLVLSSALILGLASCSPNSPATSSEQPDESSAIDTADYASLGAAAITNISASFDKWATGIAVDQSLPTESKVTDNGKEYAFAITYTVSDAAKSHLAISEDGAKLIVSCDETDHLYKDAVTAHASIDGLEKASKSFNVKVSAKAYIALSKVYEAKDGETVTTRGYVELVNSNSNIITVSSGTSSVALYTTTASYYSGDKALKSGDLIEVSGEVDIYSGLYELKPSAITVLEEDDSTAKPVALTLGGKTDLEDKATIQSRKASAEGYLSALSFTHNKTNSKKTRTYELIDATVIVGSADEGWQSVSIHLESDRLYDADSILASWKYDATEGKFGDDAPKVGDKVSFEGYMDWYNAAQVGNATLKSKAAWEGEKPSAKEKDVVKTTIAELNKKTAAENDVAYEVSGIYEVSGGKKYLTDKATGESILIYNLTATSGKGVTWNGLDGYTYEKDSNAESSLSELKAGEEVTLKALNAYYSYTKTPEINANLISHQASAYASYTASIEATGDENATVSLSKTDGLAYGEEVSVTATAGTEGYSLSSVVVIDAAGNETDITAAMKFTATCVNKVKVTFWNSSLIHSTTLTAETLKLGSYTSTPTSTKVDGVTWSYVQVMKGSQGANAGTIQMRINSGNKGDGVASNIYNTTPFAKAIKNVVVTFRAMQNQNLISVVSGTSPITTASTSETGPWEASTTQTEYTYTPSAESTSDVYLSISHTTNGGAVYIDSIVINFVD